MSIRPFFIDPGNGQVVLTLKPDGGPPDPTILTTGADLCSPGREVITPADVTCDFETPWFYAVSELIKGDLEELELRNCWRQTWKTTITWQSSLYDLTHTDGVVPPTIQTVQASWGETAQLTWTTSLRGTNPPHAALSAALGDDVLRAICWHESAWRQFNPSTLLPMKNVNTNGTTDWGMMQINQGTTRQAWSWPDNLAAGKAIFAGKMSAAKAYLDQHGNYSQDMLLHEALQRYNGGVYYRWNGIAWDKASNSGYADLISQILQSRPWGVERESEQLLEA